ncbi:MAG: RNA-binding protein [Candidatus Altiarchaeota archaeon]|nr:RNA-binding protein [Candidatus Altiarchaeota archaeon]
MLKIKDRELVIPGQLLGDDLFYDPNCFIEDRNVYSAVEGLVRVDGRKIRVIPSTGGYIPKREDVVIGVIKEVLTGRWLVDINSAYLCTMRGEEVSKDAVKKDLSQYFKTGDIITAKVSDVNEVYSCSLIKPWKMENGLIIDVNPKRIPRVVGKQKSMLNMIRDKTQSRIIVGQNGKIWLKGGNTDLAVETIKNIEKYAQTQGLTDKIAESLNGKSAF